MWSMNKKTNALLAGFLLFAAAASTASAQDGDDRKQAQDVPTEREILMELYQATGGENWSENYGWSENLDDLCDWYGVICDTDDLEITGRERKLRALQDGTFNDTESVVLGLKLQSNYLVGRIPDSLWQLPLLEEIDLSSNEHLEVSFTGLAMPLKSTNSNNRNLQVLRLQNTATKSVAGISALEESLRVLQLSKNDLNSQIPQELFSLTMLSTLSLAECNVQGTLPTEINQLSQLHELNLFENSLTGRLPETMSRLVHLRKLALSYNEFQGQLPTWLNDFPRLQQFWAVGNDFTGALPAFPNAPDMVRLNVQHNDLSGNFELNFLEAVLSRSNTDAEVTVDVRHNSMGGEVPESLNSFRHLPMNFYLGDNEFTGFETERLCESSHWNGGLLPQLGCSGLMCPMGRFSSSGMATADETCQVCPSLVDYLGATNCFDKDDKSVLSELYVSTGGATDWYITDGWMIEDDVCDWYGITCWDTNDAKQGRVRKIELRNNNLQGKIPDTIYSMIDLTTIDISQNPDAVLGFLHISESEHIYSIHVGGTATQSLDGIGDAQDFFHELWADGLNMQGPIPSDLFEATSLRRISLQDCGFSGGLDGDDLLNLPFLEELYLSDNNLQGNLPDVFDIGLTNLRILALAKNAFRGPLPASWDTAPALEAVTVYDQSTKGGGLTGAVPSYATSRTLRQLILGMNELEGAIPDDLLASMESDTLLTIDLSHNTLTGAVPQEFVRFDRLNIYLEGNFISELPEQLCRQTAWMSGNVDTYGCDAILCPKGTMGGRRQYIDSGCEPCPVIDGIENLDPADGSDTTDFDTLFFGQPSCDKENDDLTERDILTLLYETCGGLGWHSSKHWLSEKTVCDWYGISCDDTGSVNSIVLGNNQLVGSLPTEIFLLPSLQHLKLYSNTLYFDYEGLSNAKNLESLSLDGTGLDTLKGIGAARSLRSLNVAGNVLEGPVPEELSRLVHLESLSLSNNQFTGYMPYWLRALQSLKTLSISRNKLQGALYDFSNFADLEILDLSYNQLSGEIPSTFLESVDDEDKVIADLAHNRLSGTVPSELGRMSRLTLTLTDNRISAIHEDLCDVEGWNDYDVEDFGCDGILCPAGTYSVSGGRQSSDESPCEPCGSARYMGTSTCGDGSASAPRANVVASCAGTALVVIASSWLMMLI